MALNRLHFRSQVLGMETSLTVTLPSFVKAGTKPDQPLDEIYKQNIKFPTLYLMHGGSSDSFSYLRYTNTERYADEAGIMTVAMDIEESFLCDMKHGRKYFTYVTEEIPRLVQAYYPSSGKREDNFIAGFSMGAHCAMKAALRCPEKYSAVFSMSGAKDQVKMYRLAKEMGFKDNSIHIDAFGPMDDLYGTENDLLYLAKSLAESDRPRPRIMHSCGTEDYGFKLCREFADYLDSIGLENTFYAVPGIHDFDYADSMFRKIFKEDLLRK